jgi:site-specific DNA-cytosine methylase
MLRDLRHVILDLEQDGHRRTSLRRAFNHGVLQGGATFDDLLSAADNEEDRGFIRLKRSHNRRLREADWDDDDDDDDDEMTFQPKRRVVSTSFLSDDTDDEEATDDDDDDDDDDEVTFQPKRHRVVSTSFLSDDTDDEEATDDDDDDDDDEMTFQPKRRVVSTSFLSDDEVDTDDEEEVNMPQVAYEKVSMESAFKIAKNLGDPAAIQWCEEFSHGELNAMEDIQKVHRWFITDSGEAWWLDAVKWYLGMYKPPHNNAKNGEALIFDTSILNEIPADKRTALSKTIYWPAFIEQIKNVQKPIDISTWVRLAIATQLKKKKEQLKKKKEQLKTKKEQMENREKLETLQEQYNRLKKKYKEWKSLSKHYETKKVVSVPVWGNISKQYRYASKEPAYRLLKSASKFWIRRLTEPQLIETRVIANQSTAEKYPIGETLEIMVNTKLHRKISPGEARILMTFPRDYKLFCYSCTEDSIKKCENNVCTIDNDAVSICCEASPKTEREAKVMNRVTEDERCFGDAVPPLVAFRIATQIVANFGTKKRYFVDIFSSCGGTSCGFALSGKFDALLAVDMEWKKGLMYSNNFPSCYVVINELQIPLIDFNESDEYFENFAERCPDTMKDDYEHYTTLIVRRAITKSHNTQNPESTPEWHTWLKTKDYSKLNLPPIHLHGSPSCVDFSPLAGKRNNNAALSGQSMTTMMWFAGFYAYTKQFNLFDTMSLEEAQKTEKQDKKNKILHAAFKIIGVKDARDIKRFEKNTPYWYNVDYTICGVPSSGKRMYVIQGADPTKLSWGDLDFGSMYINKLRGGSRALQIYEDGIVSTSDHIMTLPAEERPTFALKSLYAFIAPKRKNFGRQTENSLWVNDIPLSKFGTRAGTRLDTLRYYQSIVRNHAENGLLTPEGFESVVYDDKRGYMNKGRSFHSAAMQRVVEFIHETNYSPEQAARVLVSMYAGARGGELGRLMDHASAPRLAPEDLAKSKQSLWEYADNKRTSQVEAIHSALIDKMGCTMTMLERHRDAIPSFEDLLTQNLDVFFRRNSRLYHPDRSSTEEWNTYVGCFKMLQKLLN